MTRIIGDTLLMVYPLTYGRARLGIGPVGTLWFDEEW
jgi:hypothetical protein